MDKRNTPHRPPFIQVPSQSAQTQNTQHSTVLRYNKSPWHYNPDHDCCVNMGTTEP